MRSDGSLAQVVPVWSRIDGVTDRETAVRVLGFVHPFRAVPASFSDRVALGVYNIVDLQYAYVAELSLPVGEKPAMFAESLGSWPVGRAGQVKAHFRLTQD